jgi:hypothetical protein
VPGFLHQTQSRSPIIFLPYPILEIGDKGSLSPSTRTPLSRIYGDGFIQNGLADDYRIAVWPVILGCGNHYWGPMWKQQTLKLNSFKTLKNGELILHYETVR